MRIGKLFMTGLAVVFTSLALVGCGGSGSSASQGKIVIGLDDNYPPMGFRDESGNITGFDVDLAKEAAKRMGEEVEFKGIDWSSKEAELQSGRVDALWNGLEITEDRAKNMLFTKPYMQDRQVIFRRADDNSIQKPEDLRGKVVATQSGSSTAEDYLDSNQQAMGFKEVKKYPDFLSAFMDLENGRVDAVVCDEIIGRYYMEKHPQKLAAVAGHVGAVTDFGVGVKKDDTALKDRLDKVLDEMRQDGTMAKISEKWFGKDLTTL